MPGPLIAGLSFDQPRIMGVLNVTPDSFSDGGRYRYVDAAVARAQKLVRDGAHIVDVGGESTRPGAPAVSAAEELARVEPVLEALAEFSTPLSIDTSKAVVAARAIELGCGLVNDVTALGDPEMASVVAAGGVGLVLMHMRGDPRSMQDGVSYDDVVEEVRTYLAQAIERAVGSGIPEERIIVDPGIGFGKQLEHNLALTRGLDRIASLGRPVLYGPSRKRFLGEITGRDAADRDKATAAVCALAIAHGANMVRVHEPAAVIDAVKVAGALRAGTTAPG